MGPKEASDCRDDGLFIPSPALFDYAGTRGQDAK